MYLCSCRCSRLLSRLRELHTVTKLLRTFLISAELEMAQREQTHMVRYASRIYIIIIYNTIIVNFNLPLTPYCSCDRATDIATTGTGSPINLYHLH